MDVRHRIQRGKCSPRHILQTLFYPSIKIQVSSGLIPLDCCLMFHADFHLQLIPVHRFLLHCKFYENEDKIAGLNVHVSAERLQNPYYRLFPHTIYDIRSERNYNMSSTCGSFPRDSQILIEGTPIVHHQL